MIEAIVRVSRRWIRPHAVRLAGVLARLGDERRLDILRASFAHCGRTAVLRLPLHVEGPGRVSIGEGVSLNPFTHMWGNGGIEIGDRTMIASHVVITTLTHDPDSPQMHASLVARPVRIANDVWIGAHAVILPGVTIGAHAVVAAGSLVREDVPPYAVVAGMPAQVVRMKAGSATCEPPGGQPPSRLASK